MPLKASIIIPTYNRREILEKCLHAIVKQTLPHERYEVIVIDDGSTDGTGQMVRQLNLPSVRYMYQFNRGRAAARNHGIRLAQHEVIIFIDSDIVVNETFVEAHLREHEKQSGIIVNGVVINTTNFADPQSEKQKLTDYSRASFATGNSSVRKEYLLKVGLFDEAFHQYGWEDLELGHRLLAHGLKRIKAMDAVGFHYNPPASMDYLPEMLRKEHERGKMALLFYEKNPTLRTRLTTLLAPPFFALERLVNFGGWPDWQVTENVLESLKKAKKRRFFNVLAQFKLIHAYFEGMREGLRGSKK